MTEDQQRQSPKERKSVHDIRNQDLVSRLLAATPPYLYSAPVGPNNFFFSDMLRSLVQARNNENARNMHLQQASLGRRPRKRSWSQHRPFYENIKEKKDLEEKVTQPDKPLELTNKQLFPISAKYSKIDRKEDIHEKLTPKSPHTPIPDCKITPEYEQNLHAENPVSIPDSPAASIPPSELVLPPPPPVWYPPLYPPYGIDPLHFFIDLRVSGHIYDRKKENVSPLTNSDNNKVTSIENESIGKHRHGSAFTVPAPRNESKTASAMNLSSSSNIEKLSNYNKYYDITDTKENQPNPKNTNYVLQNLPRIYTHLTSRDSDEAGFEIENEPDYEETEGTNAEKDITSGHIDVEFLDNVKNKYEDGRCQTPDDRNQIHQID